ncbi:DUF3093 domain-containing protein [Kitasatospora sp. NPDC004723]|uniref:DUF3093 domain-containing protein n=1 Tax=Kitasatospora sp. NPDC004723 TaxID=3154288 RepID=UPI0033B148A9
MEGMYDERLTVPRSWWLFPVVIGLTLALILLRLSAVGALVGLVVGIAAGAAAISSYGSVRIRVVQGSLVAGPARIPVDALGAAQALGPADAAAWRGPKADPRAFMLLRSYVPTALRVEVSDPTDPTPYLYLSTRSPMKLAEALDEARRNARA